MSDLDKTRKFGGDGGGDKTRIVRPSSEENTRQMAGSGTAAKTRLVRRSGASTDAAAPVDELSDDEMRLVTGWLVVVNGPGRGRYSAIYDGMNSVGRGEDQATRLDFGDEAISREGHAFITYDFVSRKFYIQHGGKTNLVRVNNAPVLQPTEMKPGDEISLGNTSLRFVPFCGESFDWQQK